MEEIVSGYMNSGISLQPWHTQLHANTNIQDQLNQQVTMFRSSKNAALPIGVIAAAERGLLRS
jgi:hypothetical protein